MDMIDVWVRVLFFYFLPCALTIICHTDEPEFEEIFFTALIPVINIAGAIAGIFNIISRAFKSKGKCILGHDFENITVIPKGKPVRIPMGGIDRYKCKKCETKRTIRWSAFD